MEGLQARTLTPPPPRPEHILALKAPFTGTAQEIYKSADAIPPSPSSRTATGLCSVAGGVEAVAAAVVAPAGGAMAPTAMQKTLLVDLDKPSDPPRELWTTNSSDRYADHGTPVQRTLPNGERGIMLDGDNIYLTGNGPSPTGDHPFLNRFNLTTLKTDELFKCDDDHYEVVEGLLDNHAAKFFTRRESPDRAAQLLRPHRRRRVDGVSPNSPIRSPSCGR